MRALVQLTLANTREFTRDRAALFWTFAFPLLFILIFGVVFSRDSGTQYEVGLVNEDSSPQASVLVETLRSMDAFDLTQGSLAEEIASLEDGDRRAVIAIPSGFGASIDAGGPIPVGIHFDETRQTTQQVVLPVILQAFEVVDRTLTRSEPVVRPAFHTLQSERLSTIDFIVPGIVAFSVMNAGVFGAVNVVSLRERRVLRRLQATPVSRLTLVSADLILRMVLVLAQAAILILVARLVFDIRLDTSAGSLAALAGVVMLGGLAFLAIGFFLGSFTKTEQGFFPVAQVVTFPMMFISGVFFPIEFMPDWLRPVINVLPLTHLAEATRQLMIGGAATLPIGVAVAGMAAYLVVFVALAVRLFRWE